MIIATYQWRESEIQLQLQLVMITLFSGEGSAHTHTFGYLAMHYCAQLSGDQAGWLANTSKVYQSSIVLSWKMTLLSIIQHPVSS